MSRSGARAPVTYGSGAHLVSPENQALVSADPIAADDTAKKPSVAATIRTETVRRYLLIPFCMRISISMSCYGSIFDPKRLLKIRWVSGNADFRVNHIKISTRSVCLVPSPCLSFSMRTGLFEENWRSTGLSRP